MNLFRQRILSDVLFGPVTELIEATKNPNRTQATNQNIGLLEQAHHFKPELKKDLTTQLLHNCLKVSTTAKCFARAGTLRESP
jgi:hypothetical protein